MGCSAVVYFVANFAAFCEVFLYFWDIARGLYGFECIGNLLEVFVCLFGLLSLLCGPIAYGCALSCIKGLLAFEVGGRHVFFL